MPTNSVAFIPVALGISPGMTAHCWPGIGPVAKGADHDRLGVTVVHFSGHNRGTVAHSGWLDIGLGCNSIEKLNSILTKN